MSGRPSGGSSGAKGWSRLIQVALALYLVPALLVVLVVGGGGLLVLGTARVFTTIIWGPAAWPRTPVGPMVYFPSGLHLDERRP